MPKEMNVGCARPTGGPVGEEVERKKRRKSNTKNGGKKNGLWFGRKAPDFTAPAYYKGKFVSVKLSDYLGNGCALLLSR